MKEKILDLIPYATLTLMIVVTVIIAITTKGERRRNDDVCSLANNSNSYISFQEVLSKMKKLANEKSVDPNGSFEGYIK